MVVIPISYATYAWSVTIRFHRRINMYVILVYDVGEKRVAKMLKLCRRYLHWIQNSVFEGELTEVLLKELIIEARRIMRLEEDSLIIFHSRDQRWLEKEIIGLQKNKIDTIL